jgi:hypothetical protein
LTAELFRRFSSFPFLENTKKESGGSPTMAILRAWQRNEECNFPKTSQIAQLSESSQFIGAPLPIFPIFSPASLSRMIHVYRGVPRVGSDGNQFFLKKSSFSSRFH